MFPGSPSADGQLVECYTDNMFVYVIYNRVNKKIYIGQTSNISRRVSEHNYQSTKKEHFTSKYSGQWELIYQEEVSDRSTAIAREKQLKSSRGRAYLQNHIPG